jgi:DNA replication initiation complex subunit (GINS family)
MANKMTYEQVRQALIRERVSPELVDLPEDFYSEVARYVAELRRESSEEGDQLRTELLMGELKNVVREVEEIFKLRVIKAMDEVLKGRLPKLSLERERQAFNEIRQTLEKLRSDLMGPLLSGAPEEAQGKNVMLIFLSDVPQIVCEDLKPYGPFKSGEVAAIPRRSADLMLRRGLTRKIEVE